MLILQYSIITFSSPVNIGPCLDLWRPWSALYSTHAPRFGLRAQGQPYAVVEAPASGLQLPEWDVTAGLRSMMEPRWLCLELRTLLHSALALHLPAAAHITPALRASLHPAPPLHPEGGH